MLTSLQIKNFTIVESLCVDFEHGLIALTGETGAGKSILLDALSILLGARAPSNVIRTGETSCELLAEFEVAKNPEVQMWLDEQAISADNLLIIRRVLTSTGRHKSFINGVLFPIARVKELGEKLIHIHGQHQQHHLLKSDVQREQLDAYAELEPLLNELKALYRTYLEHQKSLKTLKQSLEHSDKRDLLSYQIKELDDLSLSEGEYESLHLEHKTISQAKELKDLTDRAVNELNGSMSVNLSSTLSGLIQSLSPLPDDYPHIKNAKELLNSALIQCEEATHELEAFLESLSIEPQKAQEIDARMDLIYALARKHQVQAMNLYDHHQRLQASWNELEKAGAEINALEKLLNDDEEACLKVAKALSKKRDKSAKLLQQEISDLIKQLGMPQGQLTISLSKQEAFNATGQDKVDYLVLPNPGQTFQPLAKIASGGELSRISLAIQVLTAEKKAYPTLIFDEVDTGIGGKTAATVGKLLRRLGAHTQVFCITHQAQVAAYAHHHYQVSKTNRNGQTFSKIEQLDKEHQVNEIARMISGLKITKQTILHAKELINNKI
jgi:DNA repair protein RecN (Recombination protein N)